MIASLIIVLQSGVGGCTPNPKKLKPATERMPLPTRIVKRTTSLLKRLGIICRTIILKSEQPKQRRLSIKGSSFKLITSARTIRENPAHDVITNAKILHTDPQNYDARAEIMWAGSLAHNDLTGCGNDGGDFVSHMLEHEMGGMFDVTHGAGLAAVWPSWARYVYKDCLPRFVKYALNVMCVEPGKDDIETAEKGIAAMEDFYHSIGMPINMKELGITPTDEQIHEMAVSCAEACGGSKGSAKKLYRDDFLAIYNMSDM